MATERGRGKRKRKRKRKRKEKKGVPRTESRHRCMFV